MRLSLPRWVNALSPRNAVNGLVGAANLQQKSRVANPVTTPSPFEASGILGIT